LLWFFVYTRLLCTIALYHPTILGTIGQSEAWYSTNSLAKRPRYESASNMTIYPQRPGEKDCAHYMLTRTCKFGDSCKFDHPVWVPEGGIPDWKEVTVAIIITIIIFMPMKIISYCIVHLLLVIVKLTCILTILYFIESYRVKHM